MIDKKTQGKKNRQAGARFELRVRKDLESKGWIVSKWMNNVEFLEGTKKREFRDCINKIGEIIPAKHKYRGPGIPMAIGTGFPDFIAFERCSKHEFKHFAIVTVNPKPNSYFIIGVEVKSNGYLSKEEKEKCKWYLENNVFSKILIASRGEKRGSIVYKEFEKGGKGKWKIKT